MAPLEKNMSGFTVSVFRIKIKGEEKIPLPDFPGSTLRGAFGMALKRTTCVTRQKDCETCMLNQKCVYATSFENIFSGDSPFLKGTDRAPHPVLIYPLELGKGITRKGGIYTIGLTVFGDKRDYLPYYIYALTRLGKIGLGRKRGKFRVVSVKEQKYPRGSREIYDPERETLSFDGGGIPIEAVLRGKPRGSRIILRTLTPLRLKAEKRLVTSPTLFHILKSAAFRLRVLSSLYSETSVDLLTSTDFDALLENVEVESPEFTWREISRYSKRQGTGMKLGGVMGSMTLSGKIGPIYPLLRVGELIHVGKNTGFGLGRYELKQRVTEK